MPLWGQRVCYESPSLGNMANAIASTLALRMAIASLRLEFSLAPTLKNHSLTDYA
jgi:hypothetical protein